MTDSERKELFARLEVEVAEAEKTKDKIRVVLFSTLAATIMATILLQLITP